MWWFRLGFDWIVLGLNLSLLGAGFWWACVLIWVGFRVRVVCFDVLECCRLVGFVRVGLRSGYWWVVRAGLVGL